MNHIKALVLFVSLLFPAIQLCAQDSLSVRLDRLVSIEDRIEVAIRIEGKEGKPFIPIWAFQFEIQESEGINYLGFEREGTLSESEAWTVASNLEKLRVGGFTSFSDAITKTGTLIVLYFKSESKVSSGNIKLTGLRINSGNPSTIPKDPSIDIKEK
jgi:hypothetical protein